MTIEFQDPTTLYADATVNGHSKIGGYTTATDESEPPTHSDTRCCVTCALRYSER